MWFKKGRPTCPDGGRIQFQGSSLLAFDNRLNLESMDDLLDETQACSARVRILLLPVANGSEKVRLDWASVGGRVQAPMVKGSENASAESGFIVHRGTKHLAVFGLTFFAPLVFRHNLTPSKREGPDEMRALGNVLLRFFWPFRLSPLQAIYLLVACSMIKFRAKFAVMDVLFGL